jgi:DNA-binding MarR family transcriptional regulator
MGADRQPALIPSQDRVAHAGHRARPGQGCKNGWIVRIRPIWPFLYLGMGARQMAWPVLWGADMDAVLFEMKRGHLAAARFARRMLKRFEMTPARFDLMTAIGAKGAVQSDLWRRLGVVRSAVSELLRALLALEWVKRVRASDDGRTWFVTWTQRGRDAYVRANEGCVLSGDVGVHVDAALVNRDYERDPESKRIELIHLMDSFIVEFGWWKQGDDSLYIWDPEETYHWFAEMDPPWTCGDVPFVSAWASDR